MEGKERGATVGSTQYRISVKINFLSVPNRAHRDLCHLRLQIKQTIKIRLVSANQPNIALVFDVEPTNSMG